MATYDLTAVDWFNCSEILKKLRGALYGKGVEIKENRMRPVLWIVGEECF